MNEPETPSFAALNPATVLTLTGLSFGVIAAVAALAGELELGLIALVIAGLCDLFDGRVARALDLDDRQKEFGVHIDSLADMASFGVVPGLLAVAASAGGLVWLAVAGAVVAALCAAMRLAHFNLSGVAETEAGPFYRGLPVTYVALVLPLAYVVARAVGEGVAGLAMVLALFGCAALFVSEIPVRKPSGRMLIAFPILAACVVAALLWWRLGA